MSLGMSTELQVVSGGQPAWSKAYYHGNDLGPVYKGVSTMFMGNQPRLARIQSDIIDDSPHSCFLRGLAKENNMLVLYC